MKRRCCVWSKQRTLSKAFNSPKVTRADPGSTPSSPHPPEQRPSQGIRCWIWMRELGLNPPPVSFLSALKRAWLCVLSNREKWDAHLNVRAASTACGRALPGNRPRLALPARPPARRTGPSWGLIKRPSEPQKQGRPGLILSASVNSNSSGPCCGKGRILNRKLAFRWAFIILGLRAGQRTSYRFYILLWGGRRHRSLNMTQSAFSRTKHELQSAADVFTVFLAIQTSPPIL